MQNKLIPLFAVLAMLSACADDKAADTSGAGAGTGGTLTAQGVGPGSQDDLVANVGDRVFYALDSSSVSAEGRATLDRQAAWLGRYPAVSVQVAGNCDERGTTEYNLALGQRRANASRDYLVARGVSSARVTTISYGKERPTAVGSDEQAYAQNRNAATSVRSGPSS